jgi:phosphoglycerate dehydrogenase-like enzyme
VRVLGSGPAYADAVAEFALGLALDLARGISREDRAFRAGTEQYVTGRTADSVLLRHADVGLVGFGNLGRSLLRLLDGFRPTVRVHDPWLPASVLREQGVQPASLADTLSSSTFVFVLATVTEQSRHLLGPAELDLLQPGARLVLVSRPRSWTTTRWSSGWPPAASWPASTSGRTSRWPATTRPAG